MARIIGCRDLHVATITTEGAKPVYAIPVRIPSLINLSIDGKKVEVELGSLNEDDKKVILNKEIALMFRAPQNDNFEFTVIYPLILKEVKNEYGTISLKGVFENKNVVGGDIGVYNDFLSDWMFECI